MMYRSVMTFVFTKLHMSGHSVSWSTIRPKDKFSEVPHCFTFTNNYLHKSCIKMTTNKDLQIKLNRFYRTCYIITRMLRKTLRKDSKTKFHHHLPVPTLRNVHLVKMNISDADDIFKKCSRIYKSGWHQETVIR